MAWLNELPGMGAAEDRAAKALSFPVGVASPLWLAFGAAASAGVAFWLATRWTRPMNLEALLGAPAKALDAVAKTAVVLEFPKAAPVAAPMPEPETTMELAPEPVAETVVHVAPEPVVAEPAPPEPVVAEVAPAPEVLAAPEPVAPPVPDDLTQIVGIGPKLATALAERGVTQFAQLALWGADELADIDKALNLKGRAVRDAWVAQAKRFAAA